MTDTALTGVSAMLIDLAQTMSNVARALASLRSLLERRTARLLTQDGRPLGDDDVTLEV